MANIIGNTIVLPSTTELAKTCAAIIGFRSVLRSSTYTGQNEDPIYPFSNCLDFRDNTQYSPAATSGSVVIQFDQLSAGDVDYIGIGIHNGKTAGLSGKIEVQVNGVWNEVSTLAPTGDNKTMLVYFDTLSSLRQRLTLNFTSKLFIGNIYLGKAWVFSRTPSLGFTPGHTNSLDESVGFTSETNQFIIGRRVAKGYGQKGSFDYIKWSGDNDSFEAQYIDYMNHVKDNKPLFMKWNKNLQQNFFGRHSNPNNLSAPTYSTHNTGTFTFDYKGEV